MSLEEIIRKNAPKAWAAAIAKGKAEGEAKGKLNHARRMLAKGKLTLEDIADYCELTLEQVTMLARGETPKLL